MVSDHALPFLLMVMLSIYLSMTAWAVPPPRIDRGSAGWRATAPWSIIMGLQAQPARQNVHRG